MTGTLPTPENKSISTGFLEPRAEMYRLHLYNGKITEWFEKAELTWMVKKHEGRIITIEKDGKPS